MSSLVNGCHLPPRSGNENIRSIACWGYAAQLRRKSHLRSSENPIPAKFTQSTFPNRLERERGRPMTYAPFKPTPSPWRTFYPPTSTALGTSVLVRLKGGGGTSSAQFDGQKGRLMISRSSTPVPCTNLEWLDRSLAHWHPDPTRCRPPTTSPRYRRAGCLLGSDELLLGGIEYEQIPPR